VIASKLTGKGRTTIPQPVRAALGLAEGDEIAYVVEDGQVVLTKALSRRAHRGDPFSTFWEWDSKEDDEAFADL